jgi:hypothetical protein
MSRTPTQYNSRREVKGVSIDIFFGSSAKSHGTIIPDERASADAEAKKERTMQIAMKSSPKSQSFFLDELELRFEKSSIFLASKGAINRARIVNVATSSCNSLLSINDVTLISTFSLYRDMG